MKCKTCKASCIWRGGSDKPENMKCLVGYKPITNGDQIRKMTDEEMADEILGLFAAFCEVEWSKETLLDWLRQEVSND